jgi:glycosyltransferase involved in cell wall biosynthesis
MHKALLYIVGHYPILTEKFIQREVEGLRAGGFSIEVTGVNDIHRGHSFAAILKSPRAAFGLTKKLVGESCPLGRAISAVGRALAIKKQAARTTHIHAHFLGLPTVVAYCLSELTGISYSLTAHARDIYAERTPDMVVTKAVFRTTCTETNRKHLAIKYPKSPFELVRHGINISEYNYDHPIRLEPPCRLLGVGRLVEKKGFAYLLHACALLKKEGFPFHCTLIGGGPEEHSLKHLALNLELNDEITFHEFMPHDELKQQYFDADILIVPSVIASDADRDGVPNVILEAMASGLPVVATDAGSIPELVTHERTGLLVPQRESIALAAALVRLSDDHGLRLRIAETARMHLEDPFSADVWLEQLSTLLSGGNPL